MPDGLLLYGAGLVCAVAFVVVVVHQDNRSGGISSAGWRGWLLAGLAVGCCIGGSVLLIPSLFSR